MMATLSVIRTKRGLVKPLEETPLRRLELSAIDRLPALRCNARTLHVFKHGPEAARIIRHALAKALVPYYPLAGRLTQDFLHIQCSADGVWFVEASSDSTLHSVNFFRDLHSIPYHLLLPDAIPDHNLLIDPLLQMQVTQFGCGGFVIGLIFCHTICDGLGAAQFLNAVGELARGLEKPSIEPAWHRHFFPSQEETPLILLPPPPSDHYKLEHANIDMAMDQIKRLKTEFEQVNGVSCSTFEIVAAACWMSRTRAIELEPNTELKLVFFANCRNLLDPPLPNGFYGNCFFPVTIRATSESLRNETMVGVVKLIQEGKAKLGEEFGKYMKGEHLKRGESEDPFAPPLRYTTLFISEWGRLGFNQVDYQWGPPVHVVPVQGSTIIPVAIVASMPLPNRGIRLMTWCVEEPHRLPFLHHMHHQLII